MKQTAEETFDEIMVHLKSIEQKLGKKVHNKEESKKKNSHLHMFLETSLMNKIRNEANEKSISIAELVRQKLRVNPQLDRIENKLDSIIKVNSINRQYSWIRSSRIQVEPAFRAVWFRCWICYSVG